MEQHTVAASSPSSLANAEPRRRAPGRARVKAIFEATVELLQEHNPRDITISMVADRARIKRTSIYAHFPNMEAVYDELSTRYIEGTHNFVHDFIRQRQPASLSEMLVTMIDGICGFFNRMHDATDRQTRNPFILNIVVRNFDQVGASFYRAHWPVEWPVEPLSDFDPFRLLVIAQSSLFSASVARHGYITPEYAHHAKVLAVSYIGNIEREYQEAQEAGSASAKRRSADPKRRLDTAIAKLAATHDGKLVDATVKYVEALADTVAAPKHRY